MDFYLACFEITKNKDWCLDTKFKPTVVEERVIDKCPFDGKTVCAGYYDRFTNTLYIKIQRNKIEQKAVLLHEVCHWLDDFSDCKCDPYEVQRRYLFKNGEYLLWVMYQGYYHNKERDCGYD